MRRLALIITTVAVLGPQVAWSQAWEKFIMPGITYRAEVDPTGPRLIHVIRFSPGAPGISMRPEVAGLRIFSVPNDKGREELSSIIKRTGAIGGINADFFPFTADPLGAMVRAGELMSQPDARRAVFGWGRGGSAVGKLAWVGGVTLPSNERASLTGINEECQENGLVLFTDSSAFATAKTPCVYVQLSLKENRWAPTCTRTGTVVMSYEDRDQIEVQPGTAILAGRGANAVMLKKLTTGQAITIDMQTSGFDWRLYDQVVGGGPFLLRGGVVAIDAEEEGFREGFYKNRHPRTAIGRAATGEVIMAAVDGRQDMSVGCTLQEMASIMTRLGCVDAINLDGGGSTTINLFGVTLNRPSDGQERKIANAILIMGTAKSATDEELKIEGPSVTQPGKASVYRVLNSKGVMVQTSEVLWAAQGEGWIDQSGTVQAMKPGIVAIYAYARGKILKASLEIKGPGGQTGPTATPPTKSPENPGQ